MANIGRPRGPSRPVVDLSKSAGYHPAQMEPKTPDGWGLSSARFPSRIDSPESTAASEVASLLEMVGQQKETVNTLEKAGEPRDAERRIAARILDQLTELLTEKSGAPAGSSQAQFKTLEALSDLFHFDVPPSHRGSQLGRAVTGAKRAAMRGLLPFHVEVLRPQQRFDSELVHCLRQVASLRRSAAGPALAPSFRATLGPLVNPTDWQPQSHRGGVAATAVGLAKRSYLTAAKKFLSPFLAQQRKWNSLALETVCAAAGETLLPDQALALTQALRAASDPLAAPSATPPSRGAPFWEELFRKQKAFNHHTVDILSALLKVPFAPQAQPDYPGWLGRHEPGEILEAARKVAGFSYQPLLSVVVPLHETPAPLLHACIESVRAQSYPHWELCLVDDGSRAPHLRTELERLSREDKRIRFRRLEQNVGIALATNQALALTSGEFVAFLDHDDTLAPHALAEVVARLNLEPTLDVLYSDEDKLDVQGVRVQPFFKPNWSPDFLRSGNYLCHFLVVRRTLGESLAWIRPGFDGAQDFDFILRLTERSERVGHIPRILYHWRMTPHSTAQDVQNKPAASDAGVRALQEHLDRCKEAGVAEAPLPTTYRVRYALPTTPLVSIIVPHKDKAHLTAKLVQTLVEFTSYPRWELILVSNNSVEPKTEEFLASLHHPGIHKRTWNHPFNYSAINNFAVKEAKGEVLLFLNNDIELTHQGWLEELLGQALRPSVGAVGPKLLFPNGTVQHAGVVVGLGGFAGHPFAGLPDGARTAYSHHRWTRNVLAVTGACLMMRRDVFDAIGGFDERFIVCGSDVDLCLRVVRKGLRVVYTPWAHAIHDESATRRVDQIPEGDFWNSIRAYQPWLRMGDPFYNPNLSLVAGDGSFREDNRTAEELASEFLVSLIPQDSGKGPSARTRFQEEISHDTRTLDYPAQTMQTARTEEPRKMAALQRRGVRKVSWLVPYFKHPYGGIHTLLRFGDLLHRRHGVQSKFVVYDAPHVRTSELEGKVATLFPDFSGTFQVLNGKNEVERLAPSDLCIATFWMSAYLVLRNRNAAAHAYFVQDFEPLFYPAGTLYALAEQTYRLGLFGIFNTQGLYEHITSTYPMQGTWFEPAVDAHVFSDGERAAHKGAVRVFFYGRPSVDRNAFELGIACLKALKAKYGKEVEIVSAGELWRPQDFGLRGVVENLGVLPYERTADLYRKSDVGLCFMFTKHPSYLPFELMASGVTVVTNDNPANVWLLKHERNCLLAPPTFSSILQQLVRAVEDGPLRARIGKAAAERIRETSWEQQVDKVYASLDHAGRQGLERPSLAAPTTGDKGL